MKQLAAHIRIAKIEPTDADVASRQKAISTLVADWRGIADLQVLVGKASKIAAALHGDGKPDASLGQEVEAAIQAHAPSYVYAEYPLEVGVCAAMAVAGLLAITEDANDTTLRDVFAAALWSALDYQPPLQDARRESLRTELMEACRSRTAEAAETARERNDVSNYDEVEDDEEEVNLETIKDVTYAAIEGLRRNAAIDREEINFLWWVQLQRSRLVKLPLTKLASEVRLLACALEGALMLTALPAEVHRDLVLRTLDEDPTLNHKQLLEKLGGDLPALHSEFGNVDIVQQYSSVFPLLRSLGDADTIAAKAAEVSRPLSEWTGRALLEAAIVHLYRNELVTA